jgi:hypothetical protein
MNIFNLQQIINGNLETFEVNYIKQIENYDFNNESRISFSKFSIGRLVKLL